MNKKEMLGLISFSLIIGVIVGFFDVIFGKGLLLVTDWRESQFNYLIFGLPFAGLVIEFLYAKYGGESRQGMGLLFDVGHGTKKRIPLILAPIIMITTWLTHLFGGSAGREGVAVQIGGTISNWLSTRKWAHLLPQNNLTRLTLVTGMAAGFSGLFQTPVAAVFFALEVLVVGRLDLDALLPASIASMTAYLISVSLGLEKFTFPIQQDITISALLILKLVVIGIIFGLIGLFFSTILYKMKLFTKKVISNNYYRIFVGGVVLVILMLLFHDGRYAGLGTNLINESFFTGNVYSYDFLLKFILTIITLSVGFQGGEVTPLFAIGCTLGAILAPFFGLPIEVGAALGYVSVFGSATNTLIAPIMIGGEVFGFQLIPLFFITMCVAYSCNLNQSIYGKQEILELN